MSLSGVFNLPRNFFHRTPVFVVARNLWSNLFFKKALDFPTIAF